MHTQQTTTATRIAPQPRHHQAIPRTSRAASAPPAYRPESNRQQWRFMSGTRYSWLKNRLHRHADSQTVQSIHCAWTGIAEDCVPTTVAPPPACNAQIETTGTAWYWLQQHVQDSATRQDLVNCWHWSDVAEDLLEQLEQRKLLCVRWELPGKHISDRRLQAQRFSWRSQNQPESAVQHPVHILPLPEDMLERHCQNTVAWLFFECSGQADAENHYLLLDTRMLTATETGAASLRSPREVRHV